MPAFFIFKNIINCLTKIKNNITILKNGESNMEMIGNFVFDYGNDVYVDQDGILLNINLDSNSTAYEVDFESKLLEDGNWLRKIIKVKTFPELIKEIEKFLNTEEYIEWKRKAVGWPEAPKQISENEIKEMMVKSDKAELKFLQKETVKLKDEIKELEKRVDILEDSVEDLESWRHS